MPNLMPILEKIFQGFSTFGHMFATEPAVAIVRIFLIFLGLLLIYLGKKGVLEGLIMIPMGLGMATINASIMFFNPLNKLKDGVVDGSLMGTLFLDSQVGSGPDVVQNAADVVTLMGIDWLQPVYSLTFGNSLIACLVFMGIGSLLDVGFVMGRPFQSMIIALFAELGTIVIFPIAQVFGFTAQEAAAISIVGGADGPMVLFTSLILAPKLFVPIAVVAYLYLGFAYGAYPYMINALVPKKIRAIKMEDNVKQKEFTSGQKMLFAVIACVVLSFLLPIAAPLIFSLFFGVIIRESGIEQFKRLLQGPILYLSTMFLGMLLGLLCDAKTIMDPSVLKILVLGISALMISGFGGILGGYLLYFTSGGKYNPVIGIAGVSCVPTTAKVAQKVVTKANPNSIILPQALGANISGVITTAIIAGVFCSLLR